MNLTQRLSEAIRISGKSRSQLAAEIGVTTSAISQWLSGTTKGLKGTTGVMIEQATGVSLRWIEKGEGPMMLSDVINFCAADIGQHKIPLIDYVQAGNWTAPADPYATGDAEDWLLTDQSLSKSAFALEIKGDSMLPEFKPGDRVIIDPQVSPSPGNFVVAKNGEGEATFKKYRPRGLNEKGQMIVELIALNDDYPSIRSDVSPITIVGTMVEHRKYRQK